MRSESLRLGERATTTVAKSTRKNNVVESIVGARGNHVSSQGVAKISGRLPGDGSPGQPTPSYSRQLRACQEVESLMSMG